MLSGKKALVTGGTGAIGQAICLAFAGYGADVAFSFHKNQAGAEELARKIEQLGRTCFFAATDGCNEEQVSRFCERAEGVLGRIDILVNNLGVIQALPFALIDAPDWDEVVGVNLKSMFLFTKSVLRGMIRRKSGSIVNLGSIAGRRIVDVPVHYATAKAGVTGFTLSLAKEMSRYGIRVNEVTPGLITGGIGANVSEANLAEYNRYCTLGRPGKPEEVAELVAFLASDRSGYINAQSIVIDGGL